MSEEQKPPQEETSPAPDSSKPAGGVIPPKLERPPDAPSEEETLYDGVKLNRYFMLSALFFFATIVWAVLDDHNKPYKVFARKFNEIEASLATKQLAIALKNVAAQLEEQDEAEADAVLTLDENEAYQEALAQRRDMVTNKNIKTQDYNDAKARYEVIISKKAGPNQQVNPDEDPEIVAAKAEMERNLTIKEEAEHAFRAQEQAIRDFKKDLLEIRKQKNALSEELVRLETRIRDIEPSFINTLRDFPGLDFIQPATKIKQTILEGLPIDVHFANATRIDRCQTCHAAVDKPDYQAGLQWGDSKKQVLAQPYLSHPRLDLFVGPESPHKMSEFGCTTCHAGRGRALEFSRAAHTPNDLTGQDADAERWKEERDWHEIHYWEYPMLPKAHIEASCYKCHKEIVDIPQAESLTKGWRIFREVGCFGCHKIEGFEDLPKVGPELSYLAKKTTEDWTQKWVQNPRSFRPTTKMPHFFNQSNNSTPELLVRSDAEITAMVAYLFSKSKQKLAEGGPAIEALKLDRPPDPVPGKKVFETRGCMACHKMGATELERFDRHGNEFGPDLAYLGSKVNREWLQQWIKNPSNYFKGSRMPDLRLSDQEVADVAEFLVRNQNAAFDGKSAQNQLEPDVLRKLLGEAIFKAMWIRETEGGTRSDVTEEAVRDKANKKLAATEDGDLAEALTRYNIDEMALNYTRQKKIYRKAVADVDVIMDDAAKKLFVGERLIGNYGCAGCHLIPGFEDAGRIGTELTKEGSKDIHKFDFGFQLKKDDPVVKHNRLSWIYHKLKEPRIYDEGTIKEPEELLKMPNFNFTDEEARHLVTLVAGLTGENISKEYLAPKPPNNSPEQIARYERKMTINKGRKLLMKYNCIACHTVGVSEKRLANTPAMVYDEEEDEDVEIFPLEVDGKRFNYWLARDLSVTIPTAVSEQDKEIALEFKAGTFVVQISDDLSRRGIDWKDFAQVQPHLDVYGWGEGGIAHEIIRQYKLETDSAPDQSELVKRMPPLLKRQGSKVYSQWLQKFLENPERLRPDNYLTVVMPTFPMSPKERREIAEYFSVLADEIYPTEPKPLEEPLNPDELKLARAAVSTCIKCHATGDPSTYTADTVAPSLAYAKSRLKDPWLELWLVNPSKIVPSTGMPPGLFDRDRGVLVVQASTKDGVQVTRVRPGSSLAAAGIQVGDVITQVGGKPVRGAMDLPSALEKYKDGMETTIAYRRGDKTQTVKAKMLAEDRWIIHDKVEGIDAYDRDHRELMIRYLKQFSDEEGAILKKIASGQ